jgi:hypothetical protein
MSCLAFIRKPPALLSAIAALASLKLFFFFVYPSAYRHEALFVVFLLALWWIDASIGRARAGGKAFTAAIEAAGTAAFALLLVAQTLDLIKPLYYEAIGVPYSRSADAASLLDRPELRNAIVMADPDLMLEPLPYYVGNPLWFMREERFGKLFLRTTIGRQQISLDDILADADRLHRASGRPIVILMETDLRNSPPGIYPAMYQNETLITRAGARHFLRSTKLIARLRPAITDERYDVYLYGS